MKHNLSITKASNLRSKFNHYGYSVEEFPDELIDVYLKESYSLPALVRAYEKFVKFKCQDFKKFLLEMEAIFPHLKATNPTQILEEDIPEEE